MEPVGEGAWSSVLGTAVSASEISIVVAGESMADDNSDESDLDERCAPSLVSLVLESDRKECGLV